MPSANAAVMYRNVTWLLVDDDEVFLSSLFGAFGQWAEENLTYKPNCITAGNVADALIALQKESVDVMVADIRMPGVDGLQLLKLVQRKYPHIRENVLTGFGDPHLREQAMQAGVVAFLNKPMTSKDFGPLFETLIRQNDASALLVAKSGSVPKPAANASNGKDQQRVYQSLENSRESDKSHNAQSEDVNVSRNEPNDALASVEQQGNQTAGMSGVLPDVALPDLVQMLALSNRRIRLLVKAPAGEGEIIIADGRVHWANCSHSSGFEAVCALLMLKGGSFSVGPYEGGLEPNVDRSCDAILLEAAQRMDEEVAASPPIPCKSAEEPRRDYTRSTRKISLKHRRQVVIIEEESEATADWEEEAPARDQESQTSSQAPSARSMDPSSVWREFVIGDQAGRVVFDNGSDESERRLDLIEFLQFKSKTILEQTGNQRVMRVELTGEDWKALAGFGEEHSFFAVSAKPALQMGDLLSCLPPEWKQTCALC